MQSVRISDSVATILMFTFAIRAENFDVISQRWILPGVVEECTIKKPNVRRSMNDYPSIPFRAGDFVTVAADGCVQTGGAGRSWNCYVNPSGPNSDRLYFGQFARPGFCGGQLIPMSQAIHSTFGVQTGREGRLPLAPTAAAVPPTRLRR